MSFETLRQHGPVLIPLGYLVATALFVIGLKRLSSPATARNGNMVGAAGMLLAIVVTLLDRSVLDFTSLGIAMAIGAGIGVYAARAVQMTEMPQMVALLNGLGGAASALVSIGEFMRADAVPRASGVAALAFDAHLSVLLGTVIGAVTLTGSLLAFAKLQELMTTAPVTYPGQNLVNAGIFLGQLALMAYLIESGGSSLLLGLLSVLSLVFGVLLVLPIGGADMPVVIALLNSYSGIAAGMAGFALGNYVLITSGALVGASGIILTDIMCKAMNRSIWNVMFGAFGAAAEGGPAAAGGKDLSYRSATHEDVAVMLGYAQTVVVVPGYGMAVAQAQHEVRELSELLEARGVTTRFAVHPVAGRMPGHMNVLLAEANVPYPKLIEMEEINPEFERTDVVVVIGANDVVNPAARHDTASPIYGMPILDVDHAKNVVVLKRSMRPGFAGIDNELFYNPRTYMLFGDARESVSKLVKEVKGLG